MVQVHREPPTFFERDFGVCRKHDLSQGPHRLAA
jgi:hypothetical protein